MTVRIGGKRRNMTSTKKGINCKYLAKNKKFK
jgi:hypothetical protein